MWSGPTCVGAGYCGGLLWTRACITRGYSSTCWRKIALWMAHPHIQCWRFCSAATCLLSPGASVPRVINGALKIRPAFWHRSIDYRKEHKPLWPLVICITWHQRRISSVFYFSAMSKHSVISTVLPTNAVKAQNTWRRLLALGKSKHQSFETILILHEMFGCCQKQGGRWKYPTKPTHEWQTWSVPDKKQLLLGPAFIFLYFSIAIHL